MPQDPHSQKLAAERAFMNLTGVNRSQARDVLHSFQKTLTENKQNAPTSPSPSPTNNPPKIEQQVQELPRKATVVGEQRNGNVGGGGGIPQNTEEFLVVKDGVLKRYTLVADFIEDVI